ncbi:MAG: hypothetical protein OEZ58_15475 [Gammaproteobacteria bacterium]|nr:hypothetical protein [Gammaproteobacteria bacterium]MDH5730396.1 hypothetical protein [Gammaproteobacteria bacterium]
MSPLIAFYSSDRKTGSLAFIDSDKNITQIESQSSHQSPPPIMLGATANHKVVLLDPVSKQLTLQDSFTENAFAAHIYSDPYSTRDWFMNDGDKETGNDTLNCGDQGSSVTVVDSANSDQAKYLATICVGRGHHQANFTGPSQQHPNTPKLAVISNLKDGSLSFIGNDESKTDSYLKVIKTINLCEPDKEDSDGMVMPNNSFPHGLVFSSVSGKLYNLNNGYGTVAVINPTTLEIEKRFDFKGHSNLFMSPDGRYIFGRGADRKSDANHVIANLSVFDAVEETITDQIKLQDIYISKYFFNPKGNRLYLNTGASGSPEQQTNVKANVLLSFDLSALPSIKAIAETDVGQSGTLCFIETNATTQVFSSDSQTGELIELNEDADKVISRTQIFAGNKHSRIWTIE